MFRVKICGITTIEDARAAAGADAIGLNFYSGSSRHISQSDAIQIVQSLPPGVTPVGVFVNESPEIIRQLQTQLPLGFVQLHGDETPDDVAAIHGIPVIKAFRASDDLVARVLRFVEDCRRRQSPIAGVLMDAARAGMYGGTGAVADWAVAGQLREALGDVPLILAGGLTPENVAAAIRAVRPFAVNTASGVEQSPRRKDPDRIRAFLAAAAPQ